VKGVSVMDKKVTGKLLEILHKCRTLVDDRYIPPSFSGKSAGDEFAEQIVSEIESEMIKQKFCFPNSKLYLPSQFIVTISLEDSQEFLGRKREILLNELNNFVGKFLRMLSVETLNSEFIQLRTSQELKKGEIKVTHQWDEVYSPVIKFNQNSVKATFDEFEDFSEETIIAPAFWNLGTEGFEYGIDEETIVKSRFNRSFSLEVSRDGVYQNAVPIFQSQITLGRGSASRLVDIPLKNDPEISRFHAILQKEADDRFKLSVTGKNPVFVNDENMLFTGQTTSCFLGETIKIGIYSLRLKA
jgi:Protein of unknown function (DUF3662)/FHA domain